MAQLSGFFSSPFRIVMVALPVLVVGVLANAVFNHVQDSSKPPSPPREVVLYAHEQLKNSDFVEPLACALRKTVAAPVIVKKTNFPLGSDLYATPTQLDVDKLTERFIAVTNNDG